MEFLNLPLPILCDILSKYLCVNEMAYFDTAMCNYSLRSTVVNDLFIDEQFFFWTDEMAVKRECVTSYQNYTRRPFNFRLFMFWLWKRQVIVKKFNFKDFRNLQANTIRFYWERLSTKVLNEMQHFNFERFLEINDDDLQKLSESCLNTNFLNLSQCSRITNDGIRFVARFKNLYALNVSNCNIGYDALKDVASNCVNLRYLWWDMLDGKNVVEPNQAPDASLWGLVNVISDSIKDLHTISFQCRDFTSAFSFTRSTISKILTSFPLLTVLLLNGTMNFGDEGAQEIGRGCPNLKILGLRKLFGRITIEGVRSIGKGCPELLELNLSGHTLVNNSSIFELTIACKKLTHLLLRGTSVTSWVFSDFHNIQFFFGEGNFYPVCDYPSEKNGSESIFEASFNRQAYF